MNVFADIIHTAFKRSFGKLATFDNSTPVGPIRIAFGNKTYSSKLDECNGQKGKLIIFGALVFEGGSRFGLRIDNTLFPLSGTDYCPSCSRSSHHTSSQAYLDYGNHPLLAGLSPGMRHRTFTRFDFVDEWNNLGYGRIHTGDSPWAVHGGVTVDGAVELAGMYIHDEVGRSVYAGSYMTLFDTSEISVLWCARPVGPVDSAEWSIIERFVSDWRIGELPCLPCLQQTPAGCKALVTMRLDCDEDISSARELFEWYVNENIPFSLAVKTGLEMTPEHMRMLRDVQGAGGTLLSHTHTHPENWGANKQEALKEIRTSRQWFWEKLGVEAVPKLAVSPFHTNPPYAMQALEDAGIEGVVSGIIHNDPEYLLGRAGIVPFTKGKLVSISQQSMLHGDCYAQQGESVDVHIQAFEAQHTARGIFGYLDHPFSERYQYGWESEEQRLGAHQKLIAALWQYDDVWFWDQQQCFDFVKVLSGIWLYLDWDGNVRAEGVPDNLEFRPEYRLGGEVFSL